MTLTTLRMILPFAIAIFAHPASADDNEIFKRFALQLRLKQDGFYSGEVDGQFGKGSRAAMNAYATQNGIESSEDAIIEHMATRAMQNRTKPSAGMSEVAVSAIKDALKDPFSAEISVDYAQMQRGGASICGTVNAKNSYGAFTGDQAFQVTLTPLPGSSPPFHGVGRLAEDGADWLCLLGTSLLPMAQ